jgi:2-polyprenyl-3-methyl-5-hydroxy-6-metoxy-1,4-benzoquinol methylase
MTEIRCKICEAKCDFVCAKPGKLSPEYSYNLFHCPNCDFYFVSNPNRSFNIIYDEKYYCGNGADSLINYIYEIENFDKSIRIFEYEGIFEIIQNLTDKNEKIEWLDLGCGAGGLIQYVQSHSYFSIAGYDSGYGATLAKERGITILSENELLNSLQRFDVITAIETLEHVENPKEFLQTVEKNLKPGGIFFFTTGNAEPFSKNICKWNYFIPDIHISLFCEKSIKMLHETVGLDYITLSEKEKKGWVSIYKYKILKNLQIKNTCFIYKYIPWSWVCYFFDMKFKLCWGIGIKKR